MRNRQSGMTFLGLLVLIVVVGSWVYAAMRITPMYLNYMKVAGTLEKVRDEYNSNPGTTDFMIRKAIERHFAREEKLLFPAFEETTGMTTGPAASAGLPGTSCRLKASQVEAATPGASS